MTQYYPAQSVPVRPRGRGLVLGILSILLFLTGPLACALGYVSVAQARRSHGQTILGTIGFILGIATSIGMATYIGFRVHDIWQLL